MAAPLEGKQMTAGEHEIAWMPSPKLASDMYFYRLEADEFKASKQRVLLR